MGVAIRSTVRKAAKLAVYDDKMIRMKNHQIPPTIRVEAARGFKSELESKYVEAMKQLRLFYLLYFNNVLNTTWRFAEP